MQPGVALVVADQRTAELRDLEGRVRSGRLKDKARIGQAAGRILARSGVARLFESEIGEASFVYQYDEAGLDYEEQLLPAATCW